MTDLEIEEQTRKIHERIRSHRAVTTGQQPPEWYDLTEQEQLTLITLVHMAGHADRTTPAIVLWADLRMLTSIEMWQSHLVWLKSEMGPLRNRSVFTLYVQEARG